MKKVVLLIAMICSSALINAQSIFDKYEDMDDVVSVVINQRMFKLLASMDISTEDEEAQDYLNMVKQITSLKVFTTGDEKIAMDMNASVKKYLKSSKLQELMRIKEGDQSVKFYIKEGSDENHVDELLMFITGLSDLTSGDLTINGEQRDFETVLLSLTGDNFDLSQISKLTSNMNVPGGKQLEKAGKKRI